MDLVRLGTTLRDRKEPAFRFGQAKKAFTVDLVDSWEGLTTWSKTLRADMAEEMSWDELTVLETLEGKAGDAVKFLFACEDGAKIETVVMRHEDDRNTVCVSSQVGCPMKCAFCATGAMGFTRNLTAEEIFDQVIHAARWLEKHGGKVTNVVYMGMGEPMHNYDEVMRSVRLLNDGEGFSLGARHISISTCGIVAGILKLAEEPEQVNLAVSLHSAVPATRTRIMPVNEVYPIDSLMKAVATYAEKTNRKVFFEYLLLDGINDTKKEAAALVKLMIKNKRLYHANVIKYHDTHVFTPTPRDRRLQFVTWLHEGGIPATARRSFGEDIHAACGQLATEKR
ncbi:23S rRNA (adenine(2503)-C(2))-methyltransferase RlmN [Patescibacteria group bacterium]|nr:23S rRNA (adenine(2503)-C(2))-methyltransferase RlmN [Patescibacteria group bacterium]MBU1448523.1 23S rRNA (adenine(2503)-C(2))-methyltransferase RlmN [Patescibacteria group bacterium]MBU2613350.1 23S rRNA (adenine(2503)-C(2))-methyltransferase RlmN [Patescibacteria group bacterium]